MIKLIGNSSTHTGRRKNNEDAHFFDPSLGLCVVADGMGGYEGGEVASKMAVDVIREFIGQNMEDEGLTWPFGLLRDNSVAEGMVHAAIHLANKAIISKKKGSLARMGTTVAMMFLYEGRLVIGHVGDSRVYRLREGRLSQLTVDHSFFNELREAGMTAEDNPKDHPYGNVITRALGMKGTKGRPDLSCVEPRPGDVYVLCTDGLFEGISSGRIEQALLDDPGCDSMELVRRAYQGGSKDNITAAVVRVVSASTGAMMAIPA